MRIIVVSFAFTRTQSNSCYTDITMRKKNAHLKDGRFLKYKIKQNSPISEYTKAYKTTGGGYIRYHTEALYPLEWHRH